MKADIVRICREHYGFGEDFTSEYVTDCDDCRTEGGRLFSGCEKCEIRKCAQQRELENCAYCEEYACEKLSIFFTKVRVPAKKVLDEIRASIQKK